jgi:prepilin-type N-terminal cleavage/methylation domain-containing protein
MLIYRKSAFTLIELLLVMVVSLVLAGLALPAFNRLVQGNSVDRAAATVKLMAKQAQFNAVSSRRHVALLIDPEGHDTGGAPALRLAFVQTPVSGSGSAVAAFERFVEGGNWVPLTRGAVVALAGLEDANPDIITAEAAALPATNSTAVIALHSVTGVPASGNTAGLIFSRYGALYNATKPAKIVVAEAANEGASGSKKIVYTGSLSSGKPENIVKISINPFSGKTTAVYPQ